MTILVGSLASSVSNRHGVVTRVELIAAGRSPRQIELAADRGELIREHPGVFRFAAAPRTWHQRVLLAVEAGGSGTLASHRTAAVLWDLDGIARVVPEVVSPRHRRSWAADLGRRHESKDLHLTAPVERAGVPCTDVCRTILDLGAVVRVDRVQTAADDAIRRRLCTWDDLVHTLARHSRQGRRGAGPLRAVLESSLGEAVPDSRFNRLVQRLIEDAGLPAVVAEHEIFDAAGHLLARVDLALPALRIAIELDSRKHHMGASAFESDRARQNRLELEGWIVLRYTWLSYLHHPHQILTDLSAAIASRAR